MKRYLKLSTFHLYSPHFEFILFISLFIHAPMLPHTDTRKNFIIAKTDSPVYFLPVNLLVVVYTHCLILSTVVSKLIKTEILYSHISLF